MTDLERMIRDALRDPRRDLPAWPDPMPRIQRAVRRQRARLLAGGSAVGAVAAVAALGIAFGVTAPAPRRPAHHRHIRAAPCAAPAQTRGQGLGSIAYVSGHSLLIANLDTGRSHVLVRDGGASIANQPPAFSHDGRWVAFGAGSLVPAAGGRVTSPFGSTQVSHWAWSTSSDQLVAVTAKRGVVVAGPGMRPRTLLAAGWGAYDLALSPCSPEVAVTRYPYVSNPASYRGDRGIWLVDLRTGRAREVVRERKDYALQLAGWSPNGRWILYQPDPDASASIAADGLPLDAVRAAGNGPPVQVVSRELKQSPTWCGSTLVQSAGTLRYTFQNKHLIAAAAPRWRQSPVSRNQRLSWMLPACSRDGRWVAATAASNTGAVSYAVSYTEPTQLWLLRPDGSQAHLLIGNDGGRYEVVPLGWSADSRWILFQRMRVKPMSAQAELFLAEVNLSGKLINTVGPVVRAPLSLGTAPLTDGLLVLPFSWYRP